MTDSKLNRRQALQKSAGGAISLAAAMALLNEPAFADETYSKSEIVNKVAGFFGVAAQTAAEIVEHIFADLGRPNAYITGEEGSGAIGVGLRYGDGYLHRKGVSGTSRVYWQGPSLGFDTGGNAARVFTLVYNLRRTDDIYRRYPGVDGSAYFVGGVGVNYQERDNVILAPMRAGVGFRLGANVGYLAYSRRRRLNPF